MKKIFVAILTILYVGSFAGATVYNHFYWSNWGNKRLCSSSSITCNKFITLQDDNSNNNCCETAHKFINDQRAQHPALGVIKIKHPVCKALSFYQFEVACYDSNVTETKNTRCQLSTVNSSVAIYIRNCVYLL